MLNLKKYILFFILSYLIPNTSYQGLVLPSNSYHLLNSNESYIFSKNILLDNQVKRNISSSLIVLPQDINIGSFTYNSSNYKNYAFQANAMIIDYGQFIDSESQYKFSSKDFIFSNSIYIKMEDFLYSSATLNYINSNIAQYDSKGLAIDVNLYYNNKNLILSSFIKNYGFIISDYTNYSETLPQSFGLIITYKPEYLNSILSLQYELFSNHNEINIFNELLIFNNSSISIGYTTLAQELYYGNFNYDFFTGVSLGFSTIYKDYTLDIAIKNLGSIGVIHSLSISKSINQF